MPKAPRILHRTMALLTSRIVTAILLLPLVLVCRPASAQNLTTLYSFTGGADGSTPRGNLVQDGQGNLYGTTHLGGAYDKGIVFKLDLAGHLTVLHSFNGADGEWPYGTPLLDSSGFLYGATARGGPYNTDVAGPPDGDGVIYKIDTSGNNFQVLHFFDFPEGKQPQNGLIMDGQGNLYGTTYYGGAYSECSYCGGVVFKLDASGNSFQVLHSFQASVDGSNPNASLTLDGHGNLYGTTYSGFAAPAGMIFRLDTSGNNFQRLHVFDVTDGWGPTAALNLDSQGNLYSITAYGGLYNAGVVYKINTSGNDFQVLHHFNGADGNGPYSAMTPDAQGHFYGTTTYGGTEGYGVIFKIDTLGSNFEVLHDFGGPDGSHPTGFDIGLFLDAQGNLYGMTMLGGTYGFGTVFRFSPPIPAPNTKDDCKDGGWHHLVRANGSTFKNQGACVSYVNTGK